MLTQSTTAAWQSILTDLRRRIEEVNDPKLDGVVSRLVDVEGELRRVTNPTGPGHVERFDRR